MPACRRCQACRVLLAPLLLLLLLFLPGRDGRSQVPEGIIATGVPEAPANLAAAVAPYLEFRVATFQDWHPERRDVLITTRAADTAQLHLVTLPGAAPRQLTFLKEPVANATFDPAQGSRILFAQDTGGSEFFQLYRLGPRRDEIVLLTDGESRNTRPRWAPSGQQIAYSSNRRTGKDTDLYVMDVAKPETDRRLGEFEGGGWSVLDWSPDARQLLVLHEVSAAESALHLVDLGSGARRALTPDPATIKVSYRAGRFTRDGRAILVVSDRDSEFQSLGRIDVETQAWRPFGPPLGGDVEGFEVSPDGRVAAAFVNRDGVSVLALIDVQQERERRAPKLPVGVATGLRWRSNSRELGFTLSSAREASAVYSVDVRVNAITRWTRSQVAGLDAARFVEPVPVRVTAFDGRDLSGILYRPDPARFEGRRPVLVMVHGGPESQSRPSFQGRWNYLLDQCGIALLYPNVRGSAGYGKTFLTLDDGFQREDAVRDIGAFLDWIGQDAGLDSARVGIYGASYGGYMVLASMAAYGPRLRCGIDLFGISSFPSFLRNTQDYRRDLRRAEYGDERDPRMAEFLTRISPLHQVARIRQPLLIAQGRNDARVPRSEADQMVRALRGQGGEAWYVEAKDEGHGFARKPNSDFVFRTVVQFLETHLNRDPE